MQLVSSENVAIMHLEINLDAREKECGYWDKFADSFTNGRRQGKSLPAIQSSHENRSIFNGIN